MATKAQFKPVKAKRVFNREFRYKDIDWSNREEAISEFRQQLEDWFVKPAEHLSKTEHAQFTVLALTFILMDTLSQYEAGIPKSDKNEFKKWFERHFPEWGKLPAPILGGSNEGKMVRYADVIYHAYRCGILHEAHPTLCCGITGEGRAVIKQDEVFSFHVSGLTLYADGSPCPTVVVDPEKLFQHVRREFCDYFKNLLNPNACWEPLRDKFKAKFILSYGIDIGNES